MEEERRKVVYSDKISSGWAPDPDPNKISQITPPTGRLAPTHHLNKTERTIVNGSSLTNNLHQYFFPKSNHFPRYKNNMAKNISIEIFNAKSSSRPGFTINEISQNDNVHFLKQKISAIKHLAIERISLRLDPRGKSLGDEQLVADLNLPASNPQLFFRDLGPQIPWKTVFLLEYAGPFFIYPIFYLRPSFIYGSAESAGCVATIALICHSLHYAKRLYETQFVHRFSNGTMPIRNLFKNCSYYWGFAAFIAYFTNHPLFTSPGKVQVLVALCCFVISELGNFSIHTLLRDLRPPGSKERKIPYPNRNPLTFMYNFVSCPNYTYEVASWVSFSVMTQCLPAALFTLAGFLQMKQWANGKHRNYKKEFPNYPKNRKPIVPFIC